MKYMILDKEPHVRKSGLTVTNCYFPATPDGEGEGAHITLTSEGVVIDSVTIFPGQLSHWGAIKWGVLGLLHLGPLRIEKIKKWFDFGGDK